MQRFTYAIAYNFLVLITLAVLLITALTILSRLNTDENVTKGVMTIALQPMEQACYKLGTDMSFGISVTDISSATCHNNVSNYKLNSNYQWIKA